MAKKKVRLSLETLDRQKKYVAEQDARGGGLGLVFADAFLRGIRDIGYKNTAWALCEQVDNAVQADATIVAIRFGYDEGNKSKKKPDMLALIDNGVGMIPKMISYSVRWGGTDRENDRNGFGRYGYGLPSSAVSFCTRYTVYSKVQDGEWYSVRVDLTELARVSGDVEATNDMLEPKREDPPEWVTSPSQHVKPLDFASGTIILHEQLDRHTWKTADILRAKLSQHLGVNYRHWLPSPKLVVDDEVVQPVDPLFLMETGRFYDATPVMAKRVETKAFEVETARGTKGTIRVRASYLPPNFQLADPNGGLKSKIHRGRFDIMKNFNGINVCREGRQIDCVTPRWTKFQNYDLNVKIEIDFDPELDEYFGITTAKQQITIADDMWDRLEAAGGGNLRGLVNDIRRDRETDRAKLVGKEESAEAAETPRPSEEAMQETEKFKPRPDKPTDEKKAKARQELDNTAAKIAETTGRQQEQVKQELEERVAKRRFEVEFQAMPEGPFYRPKRLGEQKRLIINTLHPFYTKVYCTSPEIKSALEVLLFVLAEAELEAEGELETFYRSARGGWSERLNNALNRLRTDEQMQDKASAVAEEMQTASDQV